MHTLPEKYRRAWLESQAEQPEMFQDEFDATHLACGIVQAALGLKEPPPADDPRVRSMVAKETLEVLRGWYVPAVRSLRQRSP